jgi:hypothetical protein
VRRQSNKRNSALKVLTAAAVVAAMSAGSLTAFADTSNNGIMVKMDDGSIRRFTAADLDDEYYRNIVMNAFNASAPILVQQEADGTWNEVSENATVDGIADAFPDYETNGEADSPFRIYFE